MMRKLTLGSPLTRLALSYSLCHCHVQTTSSRMSTHAARSHLRLEFSRHQSFFSVVTRPQRLSKLAQIRTQYHTTGNGTASRSLGSSASDGSRAKESDSRFSYTPDWSKQELLMATCPGIWRQRPDGAEVIVSYVDTATAVHRTQRHQMKTALLASSTVSEHIELKPLLDLMVKDGWRVVIPDLLGMGSTRGLSEVDKGCFSYRLNEQTTFLNDFMFAANIRRVDVAIGHSLGCLLLPVIAGNFKLFGSVALIAPFPGHKPLKLIEPLAWTMRLMSWQQYKLRRYLTWLWLSTVWRKKVCRWFGIEERPYLEFLRRLFAFMLSINYDALSGSASLFELHRIPLLYVYSDADKFIDLHLNAEFAAMFSAGDPFLLPTDIYNAQCQPTALRQKSVSDDDVAESDQEQQQQQQHYVKVVRFSCANLSQMEPPVADIVLHELRQLYKHCIHIQR